MFPYSVTILSFQNCMMKNVPIHQDNIAIKMLIHQMTKIKECDKL